VRVDGHALALEPPPGLRPHPRASLGPVPLPDSPDESPMILEITPPKLPDAVRGSGECPWGSVARLRLLPGERSTLVELAARSPERIEATTIAPDQSLGEAIEPTAWVTGRSLSRYRPGTTLGSGAAPKLSGLALTLPAGDGLRFAPIDLPLDEHGRPRALDVFVTLAGTSTTDGAELRVFAAEPGAEEHQLGLLTPPAMRRASWSGPAILWQPRHPQASLRIELVAEQGSVDLRDIALFTRTPQF